jgi:Uma2 family endonuclease
MKTKNRQHVRRPIAAIRRRGQPTWEVAMLFPNQGHWSDNDYLDLDTNVLVELSDGCLEVLPMPTTSHQWIVLHIHALLHAFAYPEIGLALTAPMRVRLWPGKFREPDIVFMFKDQQHRVHEDFWDGADLVMEVVSGDPEDRHRDLVEKRAECARAGIREYWIVDPKVKQITVLALRGKKYQVAGEYKQGKAISRLLDGFSLDVASVFAKP